MKKSAIQPIIKLGINSAFTGTNIISSIISPNKQQQKTKHMKTSDTHNARTSISGLTLFSANGKVAKGITQSNKISIMKTFVRKSGVFVIILLIANLFLINATFAQVTKTWVPSNGGIWLTPGNWNPSGIPASTDHVLIPADQSAAITRGSSNNETITLRGLTIDGNVNFQFDHGSTIVCTLSITETFTVTGGKTFTVGINNAGRLNFTLASTATGTINGTVFINSYSGSGYDRTFTNNGNLAITSAGLLTGQNSSDFTLNSGATLQIGSTAGITTSGATGNIQIPGTRTYSNGANYIYNGTSGAQGAGTGLPATVSNLTISNTAGVTLPSAKVVTNNLSIASGSFINLGTFTHTTGTLTLGGTGTVSGSWGSTSSSATNKNNTYFAATTGIVNVTTSTCTPPVAPTVSSPVNYCLNTTSIPLTATGSNLLWYSGPTGGTSSSTAPTPLTTTAGSTSYYVSQTVGCEGPRAQINVIVHALPVASASQTNITCFAANNGTITISASGGTSPYTFSVEEPAVWLPATGTDLRLFTGLLPNTPYRIRVKDNNGCISH